MTGGVGGAKLVCGLSRITPPQDLLVIVNVGDDFRHLGLAISPDADTLLYTLAGIADPVQGWGRDGDTWAFMDTLSGLAGEQWFRLGDRDLAMHIRRTELLAKGESLSSVLSHLATALGIKVQVLPATDDAVSTVLSTEIGTLAFQDYFVRHQARPRVRRILFSGASKAKAAPGVVDAINDVETRAILIAPSNPFLSIDPILAVPEIAAALVRARAPVVAISPIVSGKAIKGPTAKLMDELGMPVTPWAIAEHYGGLIDAMVVDSRDDLKPFRIETAQTDTLMYTPEDKERVATTAVALADRLRHKRFSSLP